jgi:hypothetical protein
MLGVLLFALFVILVSVFFYPAHPQWWLKIETQSPRCTYYFGPFQDQAEALSHQEGYLEDLYAENAQGITLVLETTHPQQLTIFEEDSAIPSH